MEEGGGKECISDVNLMAEGREGGGRSNRKWLDVTQEENRSEGGVGGGGGRDWSPAIVALAGLRQSEAPGVDDDAAVAVHALNTAVVVRITLVAIVTHDVHFVGFRRGRSGRRGR